MEFFQDRLQKPQALSQEILDFFLSEWLWLSAFLALLRFFDFAKCIEQISAVIPFATRLNETTKVRLCLNLRQVAPCPRRPVIDNILSRDVGGIELRTAR